MLLTAGWRFSLTQSLDRELPKEVVEERPVRTTQPVFKGNQMVQVLLNGLAGERKGFVGEGGQGSRDPLVVKPLIDRVLYRHQRYLSQHPTREKAQGGAEDRSLPEHSVDSKR
jgi:hypothetical protein